MFNRLALILLVSFGGSAVSGAAPIDRATATRMTNRLAASARSALLKNSIGERNKVHADAVAEESALFAIHSADIAPAQRKGLYKAFSSATREAGNRFTGMYAKTAASDASKIAVEQLPRMLSAVRSAQEMKAMPKAMMNAHARGIIERARLADVAALVEHDLGIKIGMSEQGLLEAIRTHTPKDDYFYGQIDSIPTRQAGEKLSKGELRDLNLGLRLANATWKAGQVHRAAADGTDKRINPEKGIYGAIDKVKLDMAKAGDQKAIADVVLLVTKDLLELRKHAGTLAQ